MSACRARLDRTAFTLVEMVAATVLAVLLFSAMTGLLRSVSRQKRLVDKITGNWPSTQLLAEQLHRDVINARYVQHGPAGVRLVGTMAQDWTTRMPIGRLAEVTYRVVMVEDLGWLRRREVHLDEASTRRVREEPMWSGVSHIQLVPLEESVETEEGLSVAPIPGMRPVPPDLVIVVRGPGGETLLSVPIRHHWEEP